MQTFTMQTFHDRTAVITGAASGIGRGVAERAAQEGMRVVLADIEPSPLAGVERALRATGARALAVPTDVADASAVEALAARAEAAFGPVHLLVNCAGVAAGGRAWEAPPDDWDWVLGVNLKGVVHGLRSFVPRMLAAASAPGYAGHVVNVASAASVLPFHPSAPYQVSKAGVLALTENLAFGLRYAGAPIGVTALCPGWVDTRILDAERNRPGGPAARAPLSPESAARAAQIDGYLRARVAAGARPADVAARVFAAVAAGALYAFTDREMADVLHERAEALRAARDAAPAVHAAAAAERAA